MQSGEVLGHDGLAKAAQFLNQTPNPRVAILGGSTSAMAVAHALLHPPSSDKVQRVWCSAFPIGAPYALYYTSPEEAIADGYTEFGSADLCPLTNRVYRLAGLRLDSRELLMQVRGVGGRQPEPRMKMHLLQPQDPDAVHQIDSADLVIAALGYRPNALRILGECGEDVPIICPNRSLGAPRR